MNLFSVSGMRRHVPRTDEEVVGVHGCTRSATGVRRGKVGLLWKEPVVCRVQTKI